LFDLRPKAIEERLKLRNPIYQETAAYGHMGNQCCSLIKFLLKSGILVLETALGLAL